MINVTEILDRLQAGTGWKTTVGLARAFGIEPGQLDAWRSFNALPLPFLADAAQRSGLSLEWLVFGREPCLRSEAAALPAPEASKATPEARTPYPVLIGDETRRKMRAALLSLADDLTRDVPAGRE